jgi:mannose-6-phosphate isomerase-like protein (cupin superfamily)
LDYVRPVDLDAFKPNEFHGQVLADATSGVGSCILMCTRLPSGMGSMADLHVHVSDQFLFVLSARINIQIGAAIHKAGPGSLIFIPAGAPHWSWNEGPEDEVHAEVIVPTPAAGHPILYPVEAPALTAYTHAASKVESSYHVRTPELSLSDLNESAREMLADNTTGSLACRIDAVQVPPGEGSRSPTAHLFDEFFFVLGGRMHWEIEGTRHEAGSNTYVLLPAGTRHAHWNEGSEPYRCLSILVPGNTEADQIRGC